MSQIRLLLQIYSRPLTAFGKVIDEGRLLFAVIAALSAVLLLQIPRTIEWTADMARVERYLAAHPVPKAAVPEDDGDEAPAPRPPTAVLGESVDVFTGHTPFRYFASLVALAVCFVPAAIVLVTLLCSLGGMATILFRDYLTLLICTLLAWAAAYLPLGLARAGLLALHAPASGDAVYWWAANACFVALSVCAIRTVSGASFAQAGGAAVGAWGVAVGGLTLYSVAGSSVPYLASPFVLYYVYYAVRPDFRSFGVTLRSRRHLKEYLESSTLNPRDADAHYQLGLIYQQRRQLPQAIERFRKAIEIDPAQADAQFQLGSMARQAGRLDEALAHLRQAARTDDKCSLSEVWREIGVAQLLSGRPDEARDTLTKYLERRPYDPEGLCWYGRTLARLGCAEPARQAFSEAVEAVRTMPRGRKRQVSTWGRQASKELRALSGSRMQAPVEAR